LSDAKQKLKFELRTLKDNVRDP